MNLEAQAYVVLIVAAFNMILATTVVAQDVRNRSNVAFGLLSLTSIVWGVGTGIFFFLPEGSIFWITFFARLNYFCGGFIPVAFLYFVLTFTDEKSVSLRRVVLIFASSIAMFILHFFTDLIIKNALIIDLYSRGFIYGPLVSLFDLHLAFYFAVAFVILVTRYRQATGTMRQNIPIIIFGTYSALAIATFGNLYQPHVLRSFNHLWLGPAALIMWLLAIAYSIARHQLFSIKAISTDLVIGSVWLGMFARVLMSDTSTILSVNIAFFIAILLLGAVIIRSVANEQRLKEILERQAHERERINKQQESLLRFISREVRGYFTKAEAAFSGIQEGDYGSVPTEMKQMAGNALADIRTGKNMVASVLDVANLSRGTISYQMAEFDFSHAVSKVVNELLPLALQKNLRLIVHQQPAEPCIILGDEEKISQHVIRNIIDNSIRYTPSGSVTVEVERSGSNVRLVVLDTGIGITPEDMKRLFTEGGHGKESVRINVHSTGYGLFVAKQVVDAHHGTIRALSEGAGKGTRFVVELPLAAAPH